MQGRIQDFGLVAIIGCWFTGNFEPVDRPSFYGISSGQWGSSANQVGEAGVHLFKDG